MPESSFIPDNYLQRLTKRLSKIGRRPELEELSNHFGDPLFIAQNYVQPHCQLPCPTDRTENYSVERRPLFGEVDKFLGIDGSGSRSAGFMFVLGDAGAGKSSLLLLLKLGHTMGMWPAQFHCELVKLGQSTIDRVSKIKRPRKTVLLLDALNEDPLAAEDPLGRVAEIFRASRGFHRVICACRVECACTSRRGQFSDVARLASGRDDCATLFLSPFNDTQMDKYLKRRFRRMEDPTRKRARSIFNEMGALKGRPLLLSCTDDLVHSRCKVWNAFATFDVVIEAWLTREERKIESGGARSKFERESLRGACIKLARLMQLEESRRAFPKSELPESPLQEQEIRHLEMLDCRGRSFLRLDASGTYRFTHAGVQEFLIALGIKSGVLQGGKKRMPATDLMVSFLLHCPDADVEWRALDLTFISLAGIELRRADFSRALLASSDLTECDFHEVSFENADLSACEARGAKFAGCSFDFANAANASMISATVSSCRFTNAALAGSVLANASLDGCKFDQTGLADSNVSDCHVSRSTISDCNFRYSRLCGIEFRDSSLARVKFDQCSLRGAKFIATSLQEVSVQSADLRGAELDAGFLDAVRAGEVKNWKTAAWDPAVAKKLKLAARDNESNAEAIESEMIR